jgi:hypothetical protein
VLGRVEGSLDRSRFISNQIVVDESVFMCVNRRRRHSIDDALARPPETHTPLSRSPGRVSSRRDAKSCSCARPPSLSAVQQTIGVDAIRSIAARSVVHITYRTRDRIRSLDEQLAVDTMITASQVATPLISSKAAVARWPRWVESCRYPADQTSGSAAAMARCWRRRQ